MTTNIQRCIKVCSLIQIFGDTRPGEAAELAEKELKLRTYPDDPEMDATDAAHPAWWRGQEQAAREWSKRLEAMRAENEKLKAASLANSIKLAELESLRALLASGQCVDLARVTEQELTSLVTLPECRFSDTVTFPASTAKGWLISKAGVKL